jgi:hypothetical protein
MQEGITVWFDRVGFNLKKLPTGGKAFINVARIGAVSSSIQLQEVPYSKVMKDGVPAFRLPPQPELSSDPSTPERRAIAAPEPANGREPFNPLPIDQTEETEIMPQPAPPPRPEPRRGIAAGLGQTEVQRIAQKYSSTPITIDHEPRHAARSNGNYHPDHRPQTPSVSTTPPQNAPLAPTAISADSVVARVKSFWQQSFDVMPLALSDREIWDLYKAHGRPEFGHFLELIKRESDAVAVKEPPPPVDKLDDLKTAIGMVNQLLDEIGPGILLKVDPATHRLSAKRVKMIEEEL